MLIKEGSDVNQLVHPESRKVYEEFKLREKQKQKENQIEMIDEPDDNEDSYFGKPQPL